VRSREHRDRLGERGLARHHAVDAHLRAAGRARRERDEAHLRAEVREELLGELGARGIALRQLQELAKVEVRPEGVPHLLLGAREVEEHAGLLERRPGLRELEPRLLVLAPPPERVALLEALRRLLRGGVLCARLGAASGDAREAHGQPERRPREPRSSCLGHGLGCSRWYANGRR
jgi:hypothetical protein